MLYGVFADVHANIEALTEVLAFFEKSSVEGYIFCGDLVGCGPDPEACVQKVLGLGKNLLPVCGDHDQAALGIIDPNLFNPYSRAALLWTRKMLSEESRAFLSRLSPRLDSNLFTVAHGTPRKPVEEPLLTPAQFKENVAKIRAWPLFVGHSHMPLYFRFRPDHQSGAGDVELDTIEHEREIIGERRPYGAAPIVFNPGSVGQPLDQDWRASCALYDSDTRSFRVVRIEYDIMAVQWKIRDAGLPEFLALSLAFGQGPEPIGCEPAAKAQRRLNRSVMMRTLTPAKSIAIFVQEAMRFKSTVTVSASRRTADGKDVTEMLFLAAADDPEKLGGDASWKEGLQAQISVDGPDADEAMQALLRVVISDFQGRSRPPRLLIINDDSHARESLAEVIELEGFECRQAGCGKAGIEEAARFDPDIALINLQMPDISGFEVCETLRKRSKRTVLIIETARFLSLEEKKAGFNLGADEMVTSPFDLTLLVARMRELLFRKAEQVSVDDAPADVHSDQEAKPSAPCTMPLGPQAQGTLTMGDSAGIQATADGVSAQPRLLIIAADVYVRGSCAELFELEGFECHQAGTAQSGIDAAIKLNPDAVIMDIQLPDSSGFQICSTLRKRSKSVLLIMMTSRFLSSEEKKQGFELGADEYITKPFDFTELTARLRQFLSRPRETLTMDLGSKGESMLAENPPALDETRSPAPATLTMGPGVDGALTAGPEPERSLAMERGAVWQTGSVVDDLYEVQGLLGEGGFGSVHKVRHLGWRMDLAVKSPREDKVSNRKAMERFVAEANTWVGLGLHPHIVTCYFVRFIGGIPRIFIEYVQGGTLAEWLLERKIVDAKAAMDAAIQLARAMERSHSRGLIHRDLKPGNCLMTHGGTLKVTDFGLAKLGTDEDTPDLGPEPDSQSKKAKAREATMTGRLGTPEYMAPEQWFQAGKATHAADVWAFGVVLYELMCGRRPFVMDESEPPDAFYARMLESDWAYKFREDAPDELKKIVAACLQAAPRKREAKFSALRSRLEALYKSLFKESYPRQAAKETPLLADSLSNQGVSLADLGKTEDALRLFEAALKQDPAHPAAIYNRGVLLMRQGKAEPGEFVVELAVSKKARPGEWPPVYLSGLLRQAGRLFEGAVKDLREAESISSSNPLIRKALKAAEEGRSDVPLDYFVVLPRGAEAAQMEESLFNSLMTRARKEAESGRPAKAHELLMKARKVKGYERSSLALDLQQKLGLKGVRKGLRAGWHRQAYEGSKDALCAAISPDGKQVVSGHEDKTIKVWELETGKLLNTVVGHPSPARAVGIAPGMSSVLAWSGNADGSVHAWDLGAGGCPNILLGHGGAVNAVEVLPDGKTAFTAGDDGTLRSWDLDQGTQRYSAHAHDGPVKALAVVPDGSRAFTAGADGFVKCWDAAKGRMLKADNSIGKVLAVAASQGQPCLLLACDDGRLVKWLFETGAPVFSVKAHEGPVCAVRFAQEGRFALSAGEDKAVKVWDLENNECLWTAVGHKTAVSAACFTPDARYLVSAGMDSLRCWELDWNFEFQGRDESAGKPAQAAPRIPAGEDPLTIWADLKGVLRALPRAAGSVLLEVIRALGFDRWSSMPRRSKIMLGGWIFVFMWTILLSLEGGPKRPPAQGDGRTSAPAPAVAPGESADAAALSGQAGVPAEFAKLAQAGRGPKADDGANAEAPPAELNAVIGGLAEGGEIDAAKLYRRGLALEKEGRLVGAYAAFMAAADMGDTKAVDRKAALNPRLSKDQLIAAIRLSRAIQPMVRGGSSAPPAPGKAGIEWVTIPGGSFMMGTDDWSDTKPVHRVTVKSFQMAKTEVTNEQYRACVEAGACTPQGSESYCKSASSAEDQPVVCVDWNQAKAFAQWAGGRLPSEAEWEYAARSAGKDWKYPWGNESATCERAVMGPGRNGCDRYSTWPVCSRTAGNTQQGLCDMAGNVWEWTQDWYHDSYNGAHSDGSAWEFPPSSLRVFRGGSWYHEAASLRAAYRYRYDPGDWDGGLGFRPAR